MTLFDTLPADVMNTYEPKCVEVKPVHVFEKAGLGKAPFTLEGMLHQEISYGQRVIGSVGGCAITTKPGGTCDYCGAYILNIFNIVSADGNRFHVGSDCVLKTGDKGLESNVKKIVSENTKAREVSRIKAARENLSRAESLKGQAHPNAYHASQGKTLADYCEWLFKCGGKSGQLRAARMVEAALTPKISEEHS